MTLKNKTKDILKSAKNTLDKIDEIKKSQLDKDLKKGQEINNLITDLKNTTKKGENKMVTKSQKSDLFILKSLAAITGRPQEELLKEYAIEKTMELTTDHSNILNNVKSSDLILHFDERDKDFSFINECTRVDMNGKNQLQTPVDSENFEIKHTAEGADAPDATWDESLITITTSRAALAFYMSKELMSKTIVDQMAYVQSRTQSSIARGLLEGIFNGQGSSPQVDDSYPADGMGKKGPGLRALLSAASKTYNFSAVDVTDAAALKAAMIAFYKAAGELFAQKSQEFVLIVGLRLAQALSDAVRGKGVTAQNEINGSLYASTVLGVPMRSVSSQYLKNVTVSGSGYDATGFVSATAANNDFDVCLLVRPSKIFYAIENLEVSSMFIQRKNAWEVVLNCQIGYTAQTAELGLMGRNIGAAIA